MQFTGPAQNWNPLAPTEFLDVAVSTALTVPPLPASAGSTVRGGMLYVASMTVQGTAAQFYRTDGLAVSPTITGGIQMGEGDNVIVEGLQNIRAIRVIRGAAGGAIVVEYFYYRPSLST